MFRTGDGITLQSVSEHCTDDRSKTENRRNKDDSHNIEYSREAISSASFFILPYKKRKKTIRRT